MKKYSDYFSCLKRSINKVGNRIAITALFMVAAITMAFAQEPYRFIEGSVHHFSVAPNSENDFAWSMNYDAIGTSPMPSNSYDLMNGGASYDLEIRFNDMDRGSAEMVYLVVEESNKSGCSTKRAIQIMIEPNNMYLEFASTPTQDCFNTDNYMAPLKIGLNFKDKAAGVTIPESFFPLNLTYTVRNMDGPTAIQGNSGLPVTIAYSSANDYYLMITEAVGFPDQTTMYELTITSVKDKYDTDITNNSGDIRIQIRVVNHLPQSGNMDMALAYYIIK